MSKDNCDRCGSKININDESPDGIRSFKDTTGQICCHCQDYACALRADDQFEPGVMTVQKFIKAYPASDLIKNHSANVNKSSLPTTNSGCTCGADSSGGAFHSKWCDK